MKLLNYIRYAAAFFPWIRSVQIQGTAAGEKTASDISISYHDWGQVTRRVDKLLSEAGQAAAGIKELSAILTDKTDLLCTGSGYSIQLEQEIDSMLWKLQELQLRKAELETAVACCRMYGIFGLDYSVSASELYYKGKSVRYFSDPDFWITGADGWKPVYRNPQGEVSVAAKRGSAGQVVYLKVYDH